MTPTSSDPSPEARIQGAFGLARRIAERPEDYPELFLVAPDTEPL